MMAERISYHGGSIDTPDIAEAIERAVKPQQRSPIYWLIASGIVLVAAIVLGTALTINNFRDRTLANSKRELENTLQLLTRHFDQQLQDWQVIQEDAVAQARTLEAKSPKEFLRTIAGEDFHRKLAAKIRSMPYVGGVNFFGSDGRLINSSETWPIPNVSVADRKHFNELKFGPPSLKLVVNPVHSRVTGTWTTIFARKLVSPKGEFLGMISRGVEPARFEAFFASLSLGSDAAISMFHEDGTMIARYPHVESMIGRNFSNGPLFQGILKHADHGSLMMTSPVTGQQQIGSIRRLEDFPIVIIATKTVDAALADWHAQTRVLIFIALAASITVALIVLFIVRRFISQHNTSRQRLMLEKLRLDTAVNNLKQGLLLFDGNNRLVIFNRRYAEMFGLPNDAIKPGCSLNDIMTLRKENGTFDGDVDPHCARVFKLAASDSTFTMDIPDGRVIHIAFQSISGGGWVSTLEDITERQRAEDRIAHMARYDALTDLPNRTMFRDHLDAMLKKEENLAILSIDIDEFKQVNDTLGHFVGDEMLVSIAGRLGDCMEPGDLVARLGGDEFAIVRHGVQERSELIPLIERVHAAIRVPYDCAGHHLNADASIGIAVSPCDGSELEGLLRNADLALYAAKGSGRRTYRFFEPEMKIRAQKRHDMEMEIRNALFHQEFEVHYQPFIDVKTRRILGCEALVRWRHPRHGLVSPADFIPIAEETGLIDQLGSWVLKTACHAAADWPDDIRLAVNVSPVQFKGHTLALNVASALGSSGLPANRLELEITEAVLIRDDEEALAILHELRGLGVRIALDDFGTGYSSLRYLQLFPFDKIKIDRCFIGNITEPEGASHIVKAVVDIAAARNMTTTAEGVETAEQLDVLRDLGCDQMQGYFFSRPLTEEKLIRLVVPELAKAN
jgi:diguanylate cyclase (GGDEF)-like protein